MTRIRSFSIVFHNTNKDGKSSTEKWIQAKRPHRYAVALEPYPEGDGHHIHVFVQFENARLFSAMLADAQQHGKAIATPKPEGEERDWGRVQVDRMYGSFDQATAYLTAPKKDKPIDDNVTIDDKDWTHCDVCSGLIHKNELNCARFPDGGARCWRCLCVPHRVFETLGFHTIRNCDNWWWVKD